MKLSITVESFNQQYNRPEMLPVQLEEGVLYQS